MSAGPVQAAGLHQGSSATTTVGSTGNMQGLLFLPNIAWASIFSHLDCSATFSLALTCQACAAEFRLHSPQLATRCVQQLVPIMTNGFSNRHPVYYVNWQAQWTDSNAVRRLCGASRQPDLLNEIWYAALSTVSSPHDAQNIQRIHLAIFLSTDKPMQISWASLKAPLFHAPVAAARRWLNRTVNISIRLAQPARDGQIPSAMPAYCQTTASSCCSTSKITGSIWFEVTEQGIVASFRVADTN